MRKPISYSLATEAELPQIRHLLQRCSLPCDGIERIVSQCVLARSGNELVGSIAMEQRGRFGLLRSLAVCEDHRGKHIAAELCARLTNYARLQKIERLYLLTITAEGFFLKLGFSRITRPDVPPDIQATGEFASVCPKSAVCMTRDIRGEAIHATAELLPLRPDVPGARMWAVALEKTMLTYFEVAPNCRFDAHSHDSEQITMVLSGELFFEVGGVVHCVRAGEVIALPSKMPHVVFTGEAAVTAVDAWSPVMPKYQSAKG